MRRVLLLCLLAPLVASLACGPDRRPRDDDDVIEEGDAGTGDAGPDGGGVVTGPCRFDSECGAGRCDRSRSTCVACLSAGDCAAHEACRQGECVPRVACASSRSCPGQVCDVEVGFCVDCAADADCLDGGRCREGFCFAPPRACTSSRECSEFGQVCDTALGQCVDCLADPDCEGGQHCGEDRTCRTDLCEAGTHYCDGATLRFRCNARGSAWEPAHCAASESCDAGGCRARVCEPSRVSCESLTTRRHCSADGLSFTTSSCASGESCEAGVCRRWLCEPSANTCTGPASRRVCDADGLGYSDASCASAANATPTCTDGRCGYSCRVEYADCNAQAHDGCEASLVSLSTCGSCTKKCAPVANGTVQCMGGHCVGSCNRGFEECNGDGRDGCEADLSSVATCGSCSNRCTPGPGGIARCENGRCVQACAEGLRACNGNCVADATSEACNGSDDDCDGQVDEGCTQGTCASPHVIAPEGGVMRGAFNGSGSYAGTCGDLKGVERLHRWKPARSGTASVTMSGNFWPAGLYVRRGTCSGAEAGCAYAPVTQQWPTITTTFSVTAGETLFIFVDGPWSGTTSTLEYTLTVTPP